MSDRSQAHQRHGAYGRIPAHRHLTPYATLILAGGYQEAGESGRWRLEPGMIVVHAAGESHADWFGTRPTELVDFNLPEPVAAGAYRVPDADALARCALVQAFDSWRPVSGENDWPDLLASALRRDTALGIGDWATSYGLRAETVSRGFLQAYGVSPAQYRLGLRIKAAVNSLANGGGRLADIAFEHGFADQAHMTRAVRAATGRTPGQLRSVKSIQETARAAQ